MRFFEEEPNRCRNVPGTLHPTQDSLQRKNKNIELNTIIFSLTLQSELFFNPYHNEKDSDRHNGCSDDDALDSKKK
ncbi:MAG: hypothetical protein K2K37_13325, partial [Muribaculaceae bacterium]|nr:hypothetical protein [Muribaculaceae bacterium]